MTHSGRRVTLKRIFLCLITAAVISAAIAFAGQMWLRQISGADRVKLSDFYLFAGISAFIIFVLTLRPARRPLAFFKNKVIGFWKETFASREEKLTLLPKKKTP